MEDTPTFDLQINNWLAEEQTTLKKSTYSCYYRIAKRKIYPYFEHFTLDNITIDDINNFTATLESNSLSYKYICDILSVLKVFLEYSGKHLDFHFAKKKISHLQVKRSPQILTSYQQKKFINMLISEKDIRAIGCLLSLYTGIRIGEMCALKCKDIDLNSKTITIKNTMQRIQKCDESNQTEIIIDSPKSITSNRIIPIPKCLMDIIHTIITEPDNFFLTGDVDKYIEPRNMQNYIKKLYLKLNVSNLSYHSLRHTFATRCLEIDFDLKSLSEILGHSSVTTTLNLYVHPSLQTKRKNMDKLTL